MLSLLSLVLWHRNISHQNASKQNIYRKKETEKKIARNRLFSVCYVHEYKITFINQIGHHRKRSYLRQKRETLITMTC